MSRFWSHYCGQIRILVTLMANSWTCHQLHSNTKLAPQNPLCNGDGKSGSQSSKDVSQYLQNIIDLPWRILQFATQFSACIHCSIHAHRIIIIICVSTVHGKASSHLHVLIFHQVYSMCVHCAAFAIKKSCAFSLKRVNY